MPKWLVLVGLKVGAESRTVELKIDAESRTKAWNTAKEHLEQLQAEVISCSLEPIKEE